MGDQNPIIRQFLAGKTGGPIGMDESRDREESDFVEETEPQEDFKLSEVHEEAGITTSG
jgi:hypothetical protein